MSYIQFDIPIPEGYKLVNGQCSSGTPTPDSTIACNCTGACRMRLVRVGSPSDPDVSTD